MRKIASTILCYGIAAILLFFGMSFDKAEDLLYTQNTRNESVTMAVCAGEDTILEVQSANVEIVGAKNEYPVSQIVNRLSSGKKDVRMFLCILLVANILENKSYSDKASCEIESSDIHYRIAVLNYIHDLDGKKRV
jgi:hypothetical protein